jgi:hypothetical protein
MRRILWFALPLFISILPTTARSLLAQQGGTATPTNAPSPQWSSGAAAAITIGGAPAAWRALSLNGVPFADNFWGGDCGAKVNAALASLGGAAGVVEVSPACGNWTTPVAITADKQGIHFRPGIYQVGVPITLAGTSDFLQGNPNADSVGGTSGVVVLLELAGSNLAHVIYATGAADTVEGLVVDGQQFDSVTYVQVTSAGSGYTSTPTVAITGCSTAPNEVATVVGGVVTAITPTDGFFSGAGCSATPGCTISGGSPTSAATCTADIGGASNPTGGPLVDVTGPRFHITDSTTTLSPSQGLFNHSTSDNLASGLVSHHVEYLENQGDGAVFENVTDEALEGLSAFENNRGWGLELFSSAGSRFQNGDMGGNKLGGEHICGLGTGFTGSGPCGSAVASYASLAVSNITEGVQVGNNNGPDYEVDGWDYTNNVVASIDNIVINLKSVGSSYRTDNTYPFIKIVDSGSNILVGNSAFDSAGHGFSCGICITETVTNREGADTLSANLVSIQYSANAYLTTGSTHCDASNIPNVCVLQAVGISFPNASIGQDSDYLYTRGVAGVIAQSQTGVNWATIGGGGVNVPFTGGYSIGSVALIGATSTDTYFRGGSNVHLQSNSGGGVDWLAAGTGGLYLGYTPTSSTTSSNYSLPVNLNGTTYYLRLSSTP